MNAISELINSIVKFVLQFFGDRDDVKKVQARVVAMCGFLPSAASVAAMLSAGNPAVVGVIGVATAICQAVSAQEEFKGITAYSSTPTVNGVPIEGDWVIKK